MQQQSEHTPPVREPTVQKRKNWLLGSIVTLFVLGVLGALFILHPYVGFGAMVLAFICLATFGRSRAITSLNRWAEANGWSAISSTPPEQIESVQHAAAYADAALSMKGERIEDSRMLTRQCGDRGACVFTATEVNMARGHPQGTFVIFDAGAAGPDMLIIARNGAGPVTVPPSMRELAITDDQCTQRWQAHATDLPAAEPMLTVPLMQLMERSPECAIECRSGLVIIRAMNGMMLEFKQLLDFAQAFARIAPDTLVRRFEFFKADETAREAVKVDFGS